jgi:prephenate dehydrogenase
MVETMEADFRLQDSRIAIIGLGLMGGSLALALKGKCAALYGIDAQPATLELALDKKIVDQADTDPAKLLPQADLVILAMPVQIILNFIRKLPSLVSKPCIVIDLGSTKKDIVGAMSTLPQRFDPIGGHPICGKEKLGLENANGSLFQNAPFVVTPMERTTQQAKSAITKIISAIGAHLIEMTAGDHDRILAATSHLPFLLASALAQATSPEFVSFVGSGFKSTSRLAGTPSHMMMGILKSNRDNILNSIQTFRNSLNEFEFRLQEENYIELEILLNQSRTAYLTLTSGH